MEKTPQTPTTTEKSWQERALKAEARVELLSHEVDFLRSKLNLAAAKRFGSSSEKTNPDQLGLFEDAFNEAEATAELFAPEPELITVPEHTRKKTRSKKGASLEGLPENIIEHRLPKEELACSCCGQERHVINQEITHELRYVPASLSIDVHKQYIYGCRNCEANSDGETPFIVAAPKPKRAFPGSIASPSITAAIIDEKFVQGVPYYRQEKQWERRGCAISRQNMANWVIHAGKVWFEPIYEHMKALLLRQNLIHADETTVQVLREQGRKAESKSYMWLYRSGRYDQNIVLYEYRPSRAGEHPKEFLKGFQGYLVTDGYSAYTGISPEIINAGCFAHARRGFTDAIKAAGKNKNTKSAEGLAFCNQLFEFEKKWHDLDPQERYEQRLIHSKPVLAAFLAWLKTTGELTVPKSHLAKAINYCLNQWDALNIFLLDGRIPIDNNAAERAIRPFVIGRKNFLFCNTPNGAKASAITYSLVETAKENGLKPYDYLEYLLEELPNADLTDLERFMPWSGALPERCHTPKKK